MPPFGVFASEFLILTTAMREQPWATPFLLLALGVAFAAVFGRVQPMVFGETTAQAPAAPPAMMPVFVHLGARADARPVHSAVPRRLVPAGGAADRLGAETSLTLHGSNVARDCAGAPGVRAPSRSTRRLAPGVPATCAASGGAAGRALGARRPRPRRGCTPRASPMPTGCSCSSSTLPDADARYPGLARSFPAANRMQRAAFDLSASRATRRSAARGCATRELARGRTFRCAAISIAPPHAAAGRRTTYRSCASRATACTRSRSARCTRASSSPGHSASRSSARRCCKLEERLGYVHKGIEKRFEACAARRRAARRPRLAATPPSLTRGRTARRSKAIAESRRPARALWLRALRARARAHRQSSGRSRLLGNDARLRVRPRAVLAAARRSAARATARRSATAS